MQMWQVDPRRLYRIQALKGDCAHCVDLSKILFKISFFLYKELNKIFMVKGHGYNEQHHILV